jgi:hypothetical protein
VIPGKRSKLPRWADGVAPRAEVWATESDASGTADDKLFGMGTATLISLGGLALGVIGLLLSRVVTRRVRVRVHKARFVGHSRYGPECYFVNITNISLNREIEVTHVWCDCPGMVPIVRNERPLPKRLKADETWETWIGVDELPEALSGVDAFRLVRVRISTGRVFKSKQNKRVPNFGSVPGGDPPHAPTGAK